MVSLVSPRLDPRIYTRCVQNMEFGGLKRYLEEGVSLSILGDGSALKVQAQGGNAQNVERCLRETLNELLELSLERHLAD